MALTRNLLDALGIEKEKQQTIIDAHAETVEALKAERDKYKADAEKLPEVQKELKTAQDAAKKSGDAAKIQKDFDDYKASVEAEKTKAAKETALRKVAKDAGLTDAGIAKAVKYQDFTKIELDEKGEVKDAKELIKSLKEEWPEHIAKENSQGADVSNPPGGNGGGNGSKGNPRAAEVYKQYHAALYGGQPQQNNQAGNNGQEGANNK